MKKLIGKVTRVARSGNNKGIIINNDNIWRNPEDKIIDFVSPDLEGLEIEIELDDKGTTFSKLTILEVKSDDEKPVDVKKPAQAFPGIKEKVPQPTKEMGTQTGGPKMRGKDLLEKGHTINLQGKEFILHAGLLDIAHKMGLHSIETNMITEVGKIPIIFKARVRMKDDSYFTGYGDADDENVNKLISKHKIRMAETRAINRALRFATDIGMCSVDELGGDEKKK